MDSSSQVSQNKRGKHEYLNNGLVSPEAKWINREMLGYDNDLMALLNKNDNMDNNEQKEVEIDGVNEVGDEMMLNGVIKLGWRRKQIMVSSPPTKKTTLFDAVF